METTLHQNCAASGIVYRSDAPSESPPAWTARLIHMVIAVVVVVLMVKGECWLLEDSPAAANELTMATCILDIVDGEGACRMK